VYGGLTYYGNMGFGMRYFYPWGFYAPWYYPPYPYYYRSYLVATVRIQAEQKNADVYVDGRFAGVVDDFDGFFQGLRIEPGGHELRLYLEGYRSVSERLYIGPGESYKWRTMMEPLDQGEANEPRPVPLPEPLADQDPAGPPAEYRPVSRPPVDRDPDAAIPSTFGQIAIRVQPVDADVLIDDEPWRTPQGAERLLVHLRPGTHRIEIRKEGHDPFVTSVDVKKGETAVLNVTLSKLD
jgi:hypothetical protein